MSRQAVDQGYLDEWERQFGAKTSVPDDEDDPVIPEQDAQEEDEQHQEEPAPSPDPAPEQDDPEKNKQPVAKQPQAPEQKTLSKDDEYRAFIDSQPSEELKEQARKIVQSLKTADGRTSSLHRQLNAKDLLIQQLYGSGSKAKQEPKAPTSPRQPAAPATPPELPEKVQALKKKNPAAAEIIEEIAKFHSSLSMKQMQDMIDERLGKIEQDREVSAKTLEWNRLEERASALFEEDGMTAADVVRSEDFQAWLNLMRVHEPGIYKLYTEAKDADTAFLILQRYDQDYRAAVAQMQEQEGGSVDTPPKGDQIRQRREATRQQATGVKPSRVTSKPSDTSNLSYEEEWNLLWGPNGKYNKQKRR